MTNDSDLVLYTIIPSKVVSLIISIESEIPEKEPIKLKDSKQFYFTRIN